MRVTIYHLIGLPGLGRPIFCIPIYILIVIIICNGFYGCKTENNSTGISKIDTIKLLDFDNQYQYSDVYDDIQYIPLTGLPESMPIGVIYKLICKDDHFIILDPQTESIFIFDIEGHFKNRIQNIGAGPGEYIDLTDIYYNSATKEIGLLDRNIYFIRYSLGGEFIDETELPKNATQVSSTLTGDLLFYSIPKINRLTNRIDPCSIWKISTNNNVSCINSQYANLLPNVYSETNIFSRTYNSLLFTYTGCDQIFTVENDTLKPKYKLDFGDQPVRKIYDPYSMDYMDYAQYVRNHPEYIFPIAQLHHNDNVLISQIFTEKPNYFYFYRKSKTVIYGREAINDLDPINTEFLIMDLNHNFVIGRLYQGDFINQIKGLPKDHLLYQKFKDYSVEDPPILIKLRLKENPITSKMKPM